MTNSSIQIPRYLYLCDGKACEGSEHWHGCGECRHTSDKTHALHPDADVSTFVRPFSNFIPLFVEPDGD